MNEFKIDDEIKLLIPKASAKQMNAVTQKIVKEHEIPTVYIWNNTLCYGVIEFNICNSYNCDYNIEYLDFDNKEDVMKWICEKHLENFKELSEPMKKYVIGKLFNLRTLGAVKLPPGRCIGIMKDLPEGFESYGMIGRKMADELFLSYCTVKKYGTYAEAIDKMLSVSSELASKLVEGSIRLSYDSIMKMQTLSDDNILAIANNLLEKSKADEERKKQKRHFGFDADVDLNTEPEMKIKITPEYNPDAEINSLALTIPSWKQSIDRVLNKTNFDSISQTARKDSIAALLGLIDVSFKIIEKLEDK